MPLKRTIHEGSGRVVIEESDDRGTVESWNLAQAADMRGVGAFKEIARVETRGRARGQVLVTGQVVAGGAFTGNYLYVEFNIVGYVGSQPTIVARGCIGQKNPQQRYTFEDVDAFDELAIEARQVVDGAASSNTTAQAALLSASGRFWR